MRPRRPAGGGLAGVGAFATGLVLMAAVLAAARLLPWATVFAGATPARLPGVPEGGEIDGRGAGWGRGCGAR